MKGKRKNKKTKWSLQAQFEAEANRIMTNRSKKAANRFLDAVSPFEMAHEPAGRLAGRSTAETWSR
jgi:hypothetical protein